MTRSTSAYLTLLRRLSDDELGKWRHDHDRTERLKPSRLPLFHEHWWQVVEERSGPSRSKRASGTIGAG